MMIRLFIAANALGLAMAKGGVRVSSGKVGKLEYEDIYFLLPFGVVYFGYFLVYLVGNFCKDPSNGKMRKKCTTCNEWVANKDSEDHKAMCIQMCTEKLQGYERPFADVTCLECHEVLCIWPKDQGPYVFTCANPEDACWALEGAKIENNGSNCFRCFRCDHSICSDCVERKLGLEVNANPNY